MSFRRALGAFDATMVVVGGIIGSGIFILPSVVAQRLPTPGLMLLAWLVGGAISLAGAFAFAELAALFPRAGGEYVYLREAYHPLVAFLFGWASLLMIQGGGLGAVAITLPFVDRLFRETGTAVAPGRFFGAPAHFRIAFGGDPALVREGLAAIGRCLGGS